MPQLVFIPHPSWIHWDEHWPTSHNFYERIWG